LWKTFIVFRRVINLIYLWISAGFEFLALRTRQSLHRRVFFEAAGFSGHTPGEL
jgi:hypothetical protein